MAVRKKLPEETPTTTDTSSSRGKRLSEATKAEINRLLGAGIPVNEVASRVGASYGTVAMVRRKMQMAEATETAQPPGNSSLHMAIYRIGWQTVTDQPVMEEDLSRIRSEIEAERAKRDMELMHSI